MFLSSKGKILILAAGDLALFYFSLFLSLSLRYQTLINSEMWLSHQWPFFWIHLLWLFIFYVGGAYDIGNFASYKKILGSTLKIMGIASILAVLIFYLTPGIQIAPKTNLLIDIVAVSILLVLWRRLFWFFIKKVSKIKVLFFDLSEAMRRFSEQLKNNPQLGYEPLMAPDSVGLDLSGFIKQNNIQLIVASRNMMRDEEISGKFYQMILLGISVIDFENFYESLTEKIPVSIINKEWFLDNLSEINKKSFEKFKRAFDIGCTFVIGIITLIILPFVASAIKLESRGPVFYKQKRVGRGGEIFELIKFRTMVKDAEKDGAMWAKKNDPRITKIGKFLRKTRLDELPQVWNILKGDLSFVGPRPERPEFVARLEKEIPHYAMRHLVKPGLSGWAQIKYPYGASIEDAKEKLQYDLYYLKNRSLILDLTIAAKTIATIISSGGR